MKKIIAILLLVTNLSCAQNKNESLFPIFKKIGDKMKIGAINSEGNIIVKPEDGYESVHQFYNGMARVKKNKKYGFINEKWELVIPTIYDLAQDFSEDVAVFHTTDNKMGVINKQGEVIIKPRNYFSLNSFSDGLAIFMIDSNGAKYGAIDKSGAVIIKPRFEQLNNFNDGNAVVEMNRFYGVINNKGEYVVRPNAKYERIWDYSDGMAMFKTGDKYGFFNEQGDIAIQPKFIQASHFNNGLASVTTGDTYQYINKSGVIAINAQYKFAMNFKDGLAIVKIGEKTGVINTSGENLVPANFKILRPFKEDMAAFRNNKQWGYINKFGEIVIEPQFEEVKPFSNGLSLVRLPNNEYAYINKQGKVVFKSSY